MKTILRFILVSVILYRPCSATCSYNFTAGYDVIFLLDQRWNVTDGEIANVDDCIRRLIHYRMLIGPEDDHNRLAFVQFYQDAYSASGPNYIAEPRPVYESEFFAPMGAFDNRRKREPLDEDGEKSGLEEAISAISSVFLENEPTTRPKALFVVSNFQLEDTDQLAAITNALSELHLNVTSLGGSLDLYGIGYGSGLNATNMDVILGNESDEDCGMNTTEWLEYLDDVGRITAKGNDSYGTRRPFNDTSLCCYLCYIQLNVSLPSCSLEEFFYFTEDDLKVPGLVPLNCTAEDIQDQCVAVSVEPDDSWTWQTVSTPESTTSMGSNHRNESSVRGGLFSGLLVMSFIVSNICLSVLLLFVCMSTKNIMATRKQNRLSLESTLRKSTQNKYADLPKRNSTQRTDEPLAAVTSYPNTTEDGPNPAADLCENSIIQVDETGQRILATNAQSYENVSTWLSPERVQVGTVKNEHVASPVERSTINDDGRADVSDQQVGGSSSATRIGANPNQGINTASYENVSTWLAPDQNEEQAEEKRAEGVYENIMDIIPSQHSIPVPEPRSQLYENVVITPQERK